MRRRPHFGRTGEGVDELLVCSGPLAGSDRVVQLVVPWAPRDVLAAIHREGEVVGQSDGEESATLQWCSTTSAAPVSPSSLPHHDVPPAAYPYDRLADWPSWRRP